MPVFSRKSVPKDPDGTKERILDAAIDVFSSKGYHDTRVDEIVEKSATSKGSVYFHFPSKQSIFLALVDRFADALERHVVEAIEHENAGIDRVRAALVACLELFGRYRLLAKILLVQASGLGAIFESKRQEVLDRFSALVQSYLDEAVALGEIPPLDTEVTAHAWTGALNALIIRWVQTGAPDPHRILKTLLPILLQGVGFEEQSS
jgi:AcrR family transcriptional regulator